MVTLLYFISNSIEPKLPYQINLPIFYFTGIIVLSTSISLLLQTLTHQPVYDVSNIGFAFKGPAIYLIGFSQTKIFLYLFLTLFITYISLRDKKQIYNMFIVLLLSIAISMLQGLWRLFLHPENYIKIGIPIFYDSASSMFFMFFIIAFIILNIFEIPLNRIARISMMLFSIIGMLLIIFSFRRTIWLSFGVLLFLFPFLPLPNKKIWLHKFAGLIILILGLLFISHFNSNHTIQLPTSIENRIQSTTLGESSTLYRYVMYKEAFPLIMESPLIGHGTEPLWNNYLGYGKFKQSYENIHSLYLWLLFRWGVAGLLCFFWIIWRCYRIGLTALFKCPLNRLDTAILWIILLSLGGFLIVALFFPVYSMMRFVVIAGVLLAMELKLVSLQTAASKATAV